MTFDYDPEQEAAEYWDWQREQAEAEFDAEYPDWRESVIDPEERQFVPQQDVLDADVAVTVKTGEREYTLSPAAEDEPFDPVVFRY